MGQIYDNVFRQNEIDESYTKDGESPVVPKTETVLNFDLNHLCIPSCMRNVESRVNLRGPPRKAKYY